MYREAESKGSVKSPLHNNSFFISILVHFLKLYRILWDIDVCSSVYHLSNKANNLFLYSVRQYDQYQ